MVGAAQDSQRESRAQASIAKLLRPWLLHLPTRQDLIERAVSKELSHLCEITHVPLEALRLHEGNQAAVGCALAALRRAEQAQAYPIEQLSAMLLEPELPADVGAVLQVGVDRYRRFKRRLTWLLDPELTREQLHRLDPQKDADQIWNFVKYEFRPEFVHSAWGAAAKRIVQSPAATTFFHATRKVETQALKRHDDTLMHYYFFHNWGEDSHHGQLALHNMNRIHAHYFVHNDGMKYVLLNGGLTVLDALERVGHRSLSDTERLGYFHATINMGKRMEIQELSSDWDEMCGWFQAENRRFAAYSPLKRRMWDSIEESVRQGLGVSKPFNEWRKWLQVMGVDSTYRSALGYRKPWKLERAALRKSYSAVWRLRQQLPRGPFIESLQECKTYPDDPMDIEALRKAPDAGLPAACPFSGQQLKRRDREDARPSGAYLRGARPQVSAHADQPELAELTWDQVKQHNRLGDLWVVFDGHMYDVSSFAEQHPGGQKILLSSVGKDMAEVFDAKHNRWTKAFALNFRIGKLAACPAARPAQPTPASTAAE